MDITKLLGLRPKNNTAQAITAAIAQAETERAEARVRSGQLTAGRGKLMMTGDAKAIEAGEREITETRDQIERLGVMIEALQPTLEAAKQQEKAVEIAALAEQAEKEAAAFTIWWKSRYPKLAAELRDGLLMEHKAELTIRRLHEMSGENMAAFQASGAAFPVRPIDRIRPDGINNVTSIGGVVILPPVSGDTSTVNGAGYVWCRHPGVTA